MMPNVAEAQALYDTVRTWFAVLPPLQTPLAFFVNAPFGRFSPSGDSIFLVDGIKSWIIMELASPLTFLYAYFTAPLSPTHTGPSLSPTDPQGLLALLFLAHYANRALISPLRTPARSKSHILVPLLAIGFNIANGGLIGSYLSSPAAGAFLEGALQRPRFWAGVALWAAGFAGNILHDEVLLNVRRKSQAKGKGRAEDADGKGSKGKSRPHYAVPHGYLYRFISYPNYFCEWLEWLGFALVAAPLPSFASGAELVQTAAPPWIFFAAEVFTMIPRAWKGHQWYHSKFPDYPKERKAVIPFLF